MAVNPKACARLPVLLVSLFVSAFSLAAGGEEYVYEGKSGADWAKELKAGNDVERAQHALAALGKDAIPSLVPVLKDPDPKVSAAALAVLKDLKLDMDGVALVLPLLKDESFQVRRAAVKLLGKYAQSDPAVAASVKAALQDKDKAVVEAAEEVLSAKTKLEEEAKLRKRFEKFLANAKASADEGKVDEAKIHLDLAKSLGLDDAASQERIKIVAWMIAEAAGKQPRKGEERPPGKLKDAELQKARDESNRKQQLEVLLKQARILTDKGDLENAHRILFEATKLFPDDERAAAWLKSVEAKMRGKGDDDGAAQERELKQKPAPRETKGKRKELDQKPVPPEAPEGTF